jgi:hypothetical protein
MIHATPAWPKRETPVRGDTVQGAFPRRGERSAQ